MNFLPAAGPTPLWPPGHLPLKGGDQAAARLSPISGVAELAGVAKSLISPLEGEMAGRPEGGATLPSNRP
jgi:assimilatory nitrate reductase catalytic subunit